MKKLLLLLLLAASVLIPAASAQTTTTLTGTVRDLSNAAVTSGQVSFTLQPGIDTAMSGTARFTPSEIDCTITGAGAVKALDGVSTCTVVNNTAISQPSGTSYKVCIQPQFIQPGSCFVWYATGGSVDITQQVPTPPLTPAYNLVDTFSNQTVGGNKTFSGSVVFGGSLTLGALILSGPLTETNGGTLSGTFAGSPAFSGSVSVAGLATLSGGVCYTFENGKAKVIVSAACGYTTWALALAACPSTGCIMDGTAPDVPLAMGAFDTGSNTKPVTVNLGPYNFTATQITVRQGFKLRGAGTLSTNITSVGTNAQPLFVNPQVNNNAITTEISGMSLNALSGNTSQDGFFLDCSTLTNAGVELSRFDNLILNGFKGAGVHFKATQDGSSGSIGCTQGNKFSNVTAIRPTGATGATQNALRVEGGAGQFDFWNCWFDGQSSDTGTNVFVGTAGTQAPYSIHFHSTTNQNGFAYLFDGGTSITTEDDHFEVIKGAYNLANTAQLLAGLNFKRPHINSNVGVNAGNGYIVNIPNTVTNADVTLDTPLIYSTPDKLVNNAAGNSASVKVINARTFNSATPTNVYVSVGITGTLTPAATVDLKCWDTIQASASGTSMTTFKSCKMPGEALTIYATGGTIQFATGGNLSLGTQTSPMVVPSGDSATFMRVDAGTPAFVLIGLSTKTLTSPVVNGTPTGTGIPTVTFKKGTGAGNYSSASTTDVVVDGTNLAATITIPTGWKLSILATGGVTSLTATVTVFIGIADGGTVVYTQPVTASGVGNFAPFTLGWEINGDGAAHTIDLRYHTSNGADSVSVNNASSTQLPTITFTLTPSN